MNRLMTSILNLPGVIVEDYQQTGETLILVSNKVTKNDSLLPYLQSI